MRLSALIAAPLAVMAAGADAQGSGDLRLSVGDEPARSARPDISFRINELVEPDGSRRQRRAIVAGVEVAPDTTVGIGLFDTMPKARGTGADPRFDARAKRSRKAAVGLSLRF